MLYKQILSVIICSHTDIICTLITQKDGKDMAHHNHYITLEKKLNRKARCEKRGKYHDENRAKAKERKRTNNQVIFAAAINAKE